MRVIPVMVMSKARKPTPTVGASDAPSWLDQLCRAEPDPPIRPPDRALVDAWAPASASEAGLVDDLALSFRAHAQRMLGVAVTARPLAFYPNTLEELRACFIRGLRGRIRGAEARLAVIWWARLEDAERFALAAYLAIPGASAAPSAAPPVATTPAPSRAPAMVSRAQPRVANRAPRVAHNPTQERAPAPAAQAASLWGE